MYQYPLRYFLVMIGCLSALLIGCTKDNLEIYNRPESLAAPIYQQLDTKGNFKTLLQVIDKSGYKSVLSTGGYWTLFAPNDDAFAKYFTKAGVNLGTLDSSQARKLVQGMLVYNAYSKDKLGDYQVTLTSTTSGEQSGMPGQAFRRKTAYSKGVYDETALDGTKYKAVGINASRKNGSYYLFSPDDNNYKYLTYFTDEFMSTNGLSAYDYNYFFPSTTYAGFNVMGTKVVEKDLFAENGMIHVVDDVPVAEPSIDDFLRDKPEYSEFRNLIEKYTVSFVENAAMTLKYANQTRKSDKIFVKTFYKQSNIGKLISFNPTSENFAIPGDNTESQSNMFSIFVPTNDALKKYINEVLLEKYTSLDAMPTGVVVDLINSHMYSNVVWPSKIASAVNDLAENPKFNIATDIVEKKLLSNGFFYGTNKVQESSVFSSVYSRSYLDPAYSIMNRLLDLDLRPTLLSQKRKFAVFMVSNDAFKSAGYSYDASKASNTVASEWLFTDPTTKVVSSGTTVLNNMLRIVATSVVPSENGDLTNLTGKGTVVASNGEAIKFDNNKVYSSGTKASTTPTTVVSTRDCSNGIVYYTKDNILNFAPNNTTTATTFLADLEALGTATTSPYYQFVQYLKGSHLYNNTTSPFSLVGIPEASFYTFLIPDNNAILAAMNAGVLPSTGTTTKTPKYTPTTSAEKVLVENFIQSHIIIQKVLPVNNAGEVGTYATLLKDGVGDPIKLTIETYSANSMVIKDVNGRKANVNIATSNNLSNRSIFHSIDNYLKMK